MAASPVRAAAHVFVADLDTPEIAEVDRHHLSRVLRLREGETVTASDGRGGLRVCAYAGGGLEPVSAATFAPAPAPAVGVGFALVKSEKPEWIVQKLTELGVDRIVAFRAERSVVRWTADQAAGHAERWRRIAREAASQSRRVWLPTVEEVAVYDDLLSRPGAALADRDGAAPSLEHRFVLVGPEGGWSDAERAAATARGLPRVALGPHVLRAETAATTAGAVLAALRAGLVRPHS